MIELTYDQATHIAQTWGLVLLGIISAGVAAYAFWPGNREKFKQAAQAPLADEDEDDRQA